MSNKSTKREIFEWMVVGFLLGHPNREEELKKIPTNLLSGERRALVHAMRPGNPPAPLLEWFDRQGAPIEKGMTGIVAVVGAIDDMNTRDHIRKVVTRVRNLDFDTNSRDEIAQMLRGALEMLEG